MYKHNILWAVCLLIISLTMSCKKDDTTTTTTPCPPPNDSTCLNTTNMPIYSPGDTINDPYAKHGTIHAYRNGDKWTASGWAKRYIENKNFFYIEGFTFADYEVLREHFYITSIPLKKGQYKIDGDESAVYGNTQHLYASCSIMADDGDVSGDSYDMIYCPESWVEITHLDTENNKVAGKFEVYLAVEQPKECLQNLDNLCFKSGTFELDIIE